MNYNDNSDYDGYYYSDNDSINSDDDNYNDNNDANDNINANANYNENDDNVNHNISDMNDMNDNINNIDEEINRALELSLQEFDIKNNKIKQYAKQIMDTDDEYYKALIIENIIETEMNINIEDILKLVEEYNQIKISRELVEMQQLEFQMTLMQDKEKENNKEIEEIKEIKEETIKEEMNKEIVQEEMNKMDDKTLTRDELREKRNKFYNK